MTRMHIANRQAVIDALSSKKSSFLWRRLAQGTFISDRFRYVYVSTPKAGCSTVKTILWQLEGLGEPPDDIHSRAGPDPRPSAVTVPVDFAEAALFSPRYFRFCVWRDPVARLRSTFNDKFLLSDPSVETPISRDCQAIADAFGLDDWRKLEFDQFVEFVVSQPDEKRNSHWQSQWRVTFSDYLKYDFVVRLERFAHDMKVVFDCLHIPSYRRPDVYQRVNSTGSEAIQMSKTTARKIRDAYARDYEMVSMIVSWRRRGRLFFWSPRPAEQPWPL